MKHLLSILLLFMLCFSSQAQQNLVPNPSFEDTVYCPFGTNQMDVCANWMNFGNSPDYFNTCTGFGGPPFNYGFGFQYAHTSNAMAGIISYRIPNSPAGPNYREFIGIQLTSNLVIGQKYYFSFYANFSYNTNTAIASNKLCLDFSTVLFDSCCHPPVDNICTFYTDSILQDSVAWVKISSSFIADSAYQYLVIGNLFTDQNTDTVRLGIGPDASYYYIDDVCVSTDSLYNEIWTGIPSQNLENLHVDLFPNPANRNVTIMTKEFVHQISIFNLAGVEIASIKNIDELNLQINVSDFKPGLYFVSIKTQSSNTVQKLLIEP
jgi:Secretion system C-terminal sorting domain